MILLLACASAGLVTASSISESVLAQKMQNAEESDESEAFCLLQRQPATSRMGRGQLESHEEVHFTSAGGRALGNSFISLPGPVHTVTMFPPGVDEGGISDQTGSVSHADSIRDSIGLRTAQHGAESHGIRPLGVDFVLHSGFGGWVALFASVVLVHVASMIVRDWRRHSKLRTVQAKVQRASEYFHGLHGDLTLCLCCVEFIPSSSPSAVNFLCGHGFHTACANEWHERHKSTCPGRCPICEGQWRRSSFRAPEDEEENIELCQPCYSASGGNQEAVSSDADSVDYARLFALQSLCEKYPGIMTQSDSERLASQPTAVLMSDIQFAGKGPQSWLHSIFGRSEIFAGMRSEGK